MRAKTDRGKRSGRKMSDYETIDVLCDAVENLAELTRRQAAALAQLSATIENEKNVEEDNT